MTLTKIPGITDPYDNPELADSVLFEFFDLCYNRHLSPFICLGTALGFHRNKGYLQNDPDIDVFILCDKISRISFFDLLTVNGFVLNSIPDACPSMNVHTVKNGILLDVWFNQRKDYTAFYQGNDFISYKSRRLRIPFNIEKYLTCIYGDWKTPSETRANCFEPKL